MDDRTHRPTHGRGQSHRVGSGIEFASPAPPSGTASTPADRRGTVFMTVRHDHSLVNVLTGDTLDPAATRPDDDHGPERVEVPSCA